MSEPLADHVNEGDATHRPGQAEIAAKLVAARRSLESIHSFPGALPQDKTSAYEIQDAVLALDSTPVVGWKVGSVPSQLHAWFGERFSGPVMGGTVQRIEAGENLVLPWKEDWFQGVEAEFVFRLSGDLPPRTDEYRVAEVVDRVEAVYAGVEILGSPMSDIIAMGSGAIISDYGLNAGLVVGMEIDDWATRSGDSLRVSVSVGQQPPTQGSAAAIAGGLAETCTFLINELSRRGRGAMHGDWICTGATTGLHPIAAPCAVVIEFAGIGVISLDVGGDGS